MLIEDVDDYNELAEDLQEMGGIGSIKMAWLRIANFSDRLGVNVVEKISEELSDVGICHWPRTLPTDQNRIVLLFKRSSVLAKILDQLDNIDAETGDRILRLTEGDATKKIAKIIKVLEL